jgi:uncharacterized protein
VDVFFTENRRMRAGWRFVLGALVFAASETVGNAAGAIFWRTHFLIAQFIVQGISLTILLGGFVFLLVAVDHVEDNALASIGLGFRRGTAREIVVGLWIGCAMVVACGLVLLVWADDFSIEGHIGRYGLLRTALALAVLGMGAMAEEAAFRGYPFQRLVEAAGPVVAIIVIQIGFGFVHSDNPHVSRWGLANTALFGVLLALAYLRSRSLWLPWGIHFAWNTTLAIGFGLPMSGLVSFATLWHTRVRGPQWMTGGNYGIEGGALGTVVITLAIPAVWWLAGRIRRSRIPATGKSEDPGFGPSQSVQAN